jgi:hypothetical protein
VKVEGARPRPGIRPLPFADLPQPARWTSNRR